MPWSALFDPIILLDGRKLLTLKDAADYITKLPKKESDLAEWQTAIEVLLLCSRGGPTMMARIAVMKALNRDVERVLATPITSRFSRMPTPRKLVCGERPRRRGV